MINRNIKSLLILLKDYIELNDISTYGLCRVCHSLYANLIISSNEYSELEYFINHNRPKWYQKYYSYKERDSVYFWKWGDFKIRLKWINYQIRKIN